jgi:hypothetical protein
MKSMKKLVSIFACTFVLSLIGILIYVSTNKINAFNYYGFNYSPTTTNNDSSNLISNYLNLFPVFPQNMKKEITKKINDTINDTFNHTINNTINDTISATINNTINDTINHTINETINTTINDTINDSISATINNTINNTSYAKKSDTIVNHFTQDEVKDININTEVAKISFVQENRNNIKVEYKNTKPEKNYTIMYDTKTTENTLYITQKIITQNFHESINENHYTNNITLYVPKDFDINKLTIHTNLGDINNSDFFSNVKEINFNTNLGNINISLSNPKESVTLVTSLGEIKAIFKNNIKSFDIKSSMGNINVYLYDNDNSSIYSACSMGEIETDFLSSNKRCDYNIYSNMGNIIITKK